MWAFRAYLRDKGLVGIEREHSAEWDDQTELMHFNARRIAAFSAKLSRQTRDLLLSEETPEWFDAKIGCELIGAIGSVEGISGAREFGAYAAELLVDPSSEPDPAQALQRTFGVVLDLTDGYSVHFEPLKRVAGRLHLRAAGVPPNDFSAEVWASAVQTVLRRNCSKAWTLMEDVFGDHRSSTVTILCQWAHDRGDQAARREARVA